MVAQEVLQPAAAFPQLVRNLVYGQQLSHAILVVELTGASVVEPEHDALSPGCLELFEISEERIAKERSIGRRLAFARIGCATAVPDI